MNKYSSFHIGIRRSRFLRVKWRVMNEIRRVLVTDFGAGRTLFQAPFVLFANPFSSAKSVSLYVFFSCYSKFLENDSQRLIFLEKLQLILYGQVILSWAELIRIYNQEAETARQLQSNWSELFGCIKLVTPLESTLRYVSSISPRLELLR